MAYTKYSLTPANNNAAPPDGAPEGMLPSAVNDTMRDMMSQIRDVGDGIRDGTYTMTAPKITGGTITGVTLTGNTFSNPVVTGVSTFAAGTVSAPAITTTGDTNTGIYFPAADTIGLTVGGVESARVVSGLLSIPANSTAPSAVRLYEDTDNGTNYVDVIAPSAITSNRTLTIPDETGTILTTGSSGRSIPKAALPTGSVLQVVANNSLPSVQFTTTSTSYVTWANAPSATITLTNSSNKVLVTARIGMQFDNGDQIENTIYRIISGGSTTDLSNGNTYGLSFHGTTAVGGLYKETVITWIDTPSTASAITYTWYARAESAGLIYPDHGNSANTITLMEIAS